MTAVNQKNAPWGLARISHRPKLTFATFNRYDYEQKAGEGVDVYVLDSGVSENHQDFEGRASWGTNATGDDENIDGNGLGTHLAGIVAGRKHGVAKQARIIAVKVAYANGEVDPKALIKGLEWTVEQATASGQPSVALIGGAWMGGKDADVDEAVDAAANAGLFVVVPAGDNNDDALIRSPSGASGAFTVGASTLTDERWYGSGHGPAVNVFAPGENVLSTYIGNAQSTATLSGTAQAAAHVAYLAAYLLSTSAEVTPATVRDAITVLATRDALANIPDGTSNLLAFNNVSPS